MSAVILNDVVSLLQQKIDEALFNRNLCKDARDQNCINETIEQLKCAKLAVERRMSEPIKHNDIFAVCPHCGEMEYLHNEDGEEMDFCGYCGQALDWFESDNWDDTDDE